ncbi:CGNR zinc finger domain-containing protein [Rhodococcus sp. MEB064]|uniref:CGNR zinc finger domain-containing protein n=1 Tax=Rhodococcus sp. MEB064 TaxID=1587522 RepID=UPI0005ACB846|nr:CGNR zinc finger domain-containing protein [Rhodococcus sp. MEB064]KIQ08003.1 hypothetical protein RU01_21550 [Rhodococcus sp. MEB064]
MSSPALPPAPGTDDHPSLALVDTVVVLPGGHRVDDLGDPAAATSWLIERGLVSDDVMLLEHCQSKLTSLRQDLRTLFDRFLEGEDPDQGALDRINAAIMTVPAAPLLHHVPGRGLQRVQQHPVTQLVEYAMAHIAEDAAELVTSPLAGSIARCEALPCERLMIRTHARRRWCSVRCGDRVRAARSYSRGRQSEDAAAKRLESLLVSMNLSPVPTAGAVVRYSGS